MRARPAWFRRADVQRVCGHLAFALGLAAHFHLTFCLIPVIAPSLIFLQIKKIN